MMTTQLCASGATQIGTGVATADPTAAIAIAWGLSIVVLGGLMAFALVQFRRTQKGARHD